MLQIGLITLGCPKNQVDSEIMLGLLDQANFSMVDDLKDADIIVINTCGFIESAKQESIDTILEIAELKNSGRLNLLIVTGCLAQRYNEELTKEIPEIDTILGTGNFDQIVEVINNALSGKVIGGISDPEFLYSKDLPRKTLSPKYTAYVKIAEGCNNHCSYCIIPALRGLVRSRSIEDIVTEVESLAKTGVKEIILVAQDTTVYGIDRSESSGLIQLLKELVKVAGISWIRLMYTYPDHLTDELIQLIATEEKICKYLDLPLQHASDRILKLMNRPTTKSQIEQLINKVREQIPSIAIRTSFIVGFPGETEKDFYELVDFVKEMRFERLGVFTYSREENTPADLMDGHLSQELKEERWNYLMNLQREIALENNEKLIDRVVSVLVEEIHSEKEGIVIGRTKWDAPDIDNLVYVHNSCAQVGDLVKARIVEALEYDLVGVEI